MHSFEVLSLPCCCCLFNVSTYKNWNYDWINCYDGLVHSSMGRAIVGSSLSHPYVFTVMYKVIIITRRIYHYTHNRQCCMFLKLGSSLSPLNSNKQTTVIFKTSQSLTTNLLFSFLLSTHSAMWWKKKNKIWNEAVALELSHCLNLRNARRIASEGYYIYIRTPPPSRSTGNGERRETDQSRAKLVQVNILLGLRVSLRQIANTDTAVRLL